MDGEGRRKYAPSALNQGSPMPEISRLLPPLLIACASSPRARLSLSSLTDLPAPGKIQRELPDGDKPAGFGIVPRFGE